MLALSEADSAVGTLSGLGRLLVDPQVLIGPFLTREALDSSRIEGTNASLSEVLQAEAVQSDAPSNDDVREVERYLAAMRQGLRLIEVLPITQRLIKQLHGTLMQGVRGEEKLPGELRRTPVWVGAPGATPQTARFVPPLPEELPDLLSDWENFVNGESRLPVLVRAALMHYQFETIHPFLDGNGRIGRLLIALLLQAEGRLSRPLLYLSGYFETHRAEYYERLQAVREKEEVQEYLRFFLTAVRQQAIDAETRVGRLVALREQYQDRVRLDRSLVGAVIPMIFSIPFLTTNRVSKELGITMPGARNLMIRARDYGWIEEGVTVGRGGLVVWHAPEVLRIIEAPLEYLNDSS